MTGKTCPWPESRSLRSNPPPGRTPGSLGRSEHPSRDHDLSGSRMKDYLPTLDGWRAVAIAGVLLYHGTSSLFYPSGPFPSYRATVAVQTGALGVDVFFAISGLLICHRLIKEFN